MQAYWQFVFWLCLAGLIYIYVGYPLIVFLLARRAPRPVTQPTRMSISVVIVAYNEAARLRAKLDNLLQLDGAENILEILVGSDGSTDKTAEVVAAYPDPRVESMAFSTRRGKPAVLNALIPRCRGDIVVLADARQQFERAALTRLLENFADPNVGVVSGELVLQSDPGETTAARGIGWYWRYEKFIRRCESRYRGVPGATGACYAIRKSLFRPIREELILDDVAIPMQITMQGYRCRLEAGAIAYDAPSRFAGQEAIRKRRTIAGAAQLVRAYPHWLVPWKNPLWFEYVSHKILRLASPALLAGALAANAALVFVPAYRVLFSVQAVCYVSACVGWLYQKCNRRSVMFGPSLMFLTLNVTTGLALWDALRSRYRVTWQRSHDWNASAGPATPPGTRRLGSLRGLISNSRRARP